MNKIMKTVLLVTLIPIGILGLTIGSFLIRAKIAADTDIKNNQFDIDKDGFLAFSYQYRSEKTEKETTKYKYISTDLKHMVSHRSFTSDSYSTYSTNTSKCFDYSGKTIEILDKELLDGEGNPVPYKPLYDKFFDFAKSYSHQMIGEIDFYDFGDTLLVSYRPNVNWSEFIKVGYFSDTYQNGEVAQLETEKITGIKILKVR